MLNFSKLIRDIKNPYAKYFGAWNSAERKPPKNKWFLRKNWGTPMSAIDFNTSQSLIDDLRVHKIYKNSFKSLCEEYVLWRVEHDGSCWVSSAITQLIYQLIEAGPKKFDEVLKYFKTLFAQEQEYQGAENQHIASDLLLILELIKDKMDHGYSLALRNHRNVYQALDRGFRALLSIYWREHDERRAAQINTPGSLGYAADFKEFFDTLGLKYAEVLSDGELGGALATTTYVDFAAYLSEQEIAFLYEGEEALKKPLIRQKMPAVMSFLAEPGYMDVAVSKELSRRIIKAKPRNIKSSILNKLTNIGKPSFFDHA